MLLFLGIAAARNPSQAAAPSFEALGRAFEALGPGDIDLAIFDPPPTNRVLLVARTTTPLPRVRAVIGDPSAWRRALPEIVRADIVESRLRPPRAEADHRIAWEVEVPLWNLEGELWLRPAGRTIALEVTQGHMSPARFVFTLAESAGGTLVTLSGTANVRELNFVTRKMAARMPLAEPAMTTAVAWAMLRAFVLEANAPDRRRWPKDAPTPHESASRLEAPLAEVARVLDATGPIGVVVTGDNGRLDHAAVTLRNTAPANTLAPRLAERERYRALPGWKQIDVLEAPRGRLRWEVDTSLPFVDFDAVWDIAPGPPLRARAIDDDIEGALFGWAAFPDGAQSILVHTAYPRVEKTGFFPRRFIAAEPLLEQGLSLAFAYLNAVALAGAL